MTYLVERLAQLRRHVNHLRQLAPRVGDGADLERDQSLGNDVLFSLLMVAQLVIDIAGEISTRRGRTFADYTQAVRNLAGLPGLDDTTVAELSLLPGFRNVVMHEYVGIDYDIVAHALTRLEPVEALITAAAREIVE
ncbi:MAG TPA: HepT-like ribonuclease domain-containing protein [Steroidobacteraceae bacterium]